MESNLNLKYLEFLVPDAQWLPGGFNEFVKLLDSSQKPLRVKLGIDPTHHDLHLGHTVCLHYLRKFQERGHIPVLIIGGFTGVVGDPSGRNETRPPLTLEQVKENSKTYLEQVGKILDLKNDKRVEIRNNYDWLSKLSSKELLELAHLVTINQLIAKEAFGERILNKDPLYLHEVLYPILQGYDSKEVKADIEIGGVDQTYNVLFGRHIQKHYKQKEQFVILLPLLIGLDGKRKMSKSFNNFIAIKDTPSEIFGKTMSIPDELILHYGRLVSSFPLGELNDMQCAFDNKANPRDLKMKLAHNLVEQFFDKKAAQNAQDNFEKQFQRDEIPDTVPDFVLVKDMPIAELMHVTGLVQSKGEAKRLIAGGGVKLKSSKVMDPNLLVTKNDKNSVLQIGKRKFVKII